MWAYHVKTYPCIFSSAFIFFLEFGWQLPRVRGHYIRLNYSSVSPISACC